MKAKSLSQNYIYLYIYVYMVLKVLLPHRAIVSLLIINEKKIFLLCLQAYPNIFTFLFPFHTCNLGKLTFSFHLAWYSGNTGFLFGWFFFFLTTQACEFFTSLLHIQLGCKCAGDFLVFIFSAMI